MGPIASSLLLFRCVSRAFCSFLFFFPFARFFRFHRPPPLTPNRRDVSHRFSINSRCNDVAEEEEEEEVVMVVEEKISPEMRVVHRRRRPFDSTHRETSRREANENRRRKSTFQVRSDTVRLFIHRKHPPSTCSENNLFGASPFDG